MILLDTNVVSELLRPVPNPVVQAWVSACRAPFTTAITVQETFFGVERLPDSRRRSDLTETLEQILSDLVGPRILPFSALSARHTAAIQAHRQRLGRPIGFADAQIAGIALSRGATLATRNVRDFGDLELDVVDPWRG